METFRILTLNTLGVGENIEGRAPYLESAIRAAAPDIACLQEANKKTHRALLDRLTDCYTVAAPTHEGGKPVNYTPILFRTGRFDCLCAGVRFLRSRYTETNTKSISHAVLQAPSGARLAVINLHASLIVPQYGLPGTDAVEGAAWRVDNVREMCALADALSEEWAQGRWRMPVLFTGDFNFTTDSDAYRAARQAGLLDAEFDAGSATTGTATLHPVGTPPQEGKSIDHIFFTPTPGLRAERHRIVTDGDAIDGTDHCPVWVDMTLEKEERL